MCFQAKFSALIIALSIAQTHAAGFDDFQTPEFDATSLNPETANESNWKNTLSYANAVDDHSDTVVNRLSWRLQWESLQGENNYWVIDTKLRLFNKSDMQHASNEAIDYDLNLNSLYLQKSFDQNSLKAGFQTITLGFMDFINVSNVLTPQDFSEAVFTSPEDSRIGQAVINWTWYQQNQQIDLYVNFYPTENRYPLSNYRQILTDSLGTSNFTLSDELPGAFEEPEILLKWQMQNDEHEIQLIAASLLQNDPNLKPVSLLPPQSFAIEYPRFSFLAGAYSYTSGQHQLKTEASYKQDIKPVDTGNLEINESSIALGWEYSANGDYTLSLESVVTERDLPGQSTGLIPISLIETRQEQTVISWRKNFLNETVYATVFAGIFNPGDLKIVSLSISYTPVDDWIIELIATEVDSDNAEYNIYTSNTLIKASYYW